MLIVIFIKEIIMIHKIIARVIWRVNVYHLDLAHVGVLKQLQDFEVVALDIEVLCRVPIHALLGTRAQRLVDRCSSLTEGSTFAHPSKVIDFRSILHCLVAQQQAEFIEIDDSMHFPILPHRFREAGGHNQVESIKIKLCAVWRLHVNMFGLFHICLF